jgi:hypothetical protein
MKRRLDVGLGVAVLFLIGGGVAGATTLSTPPLSIGTDGSGLCELVNLGQTPINVTLLPVALTPGPVFDPIACTDLAPNARCVVGITIPRDVYCRFTFTGSRGSVRALIETLTSAGTATAALPAS